jgi:penicillin-binding protein 1A
MQEENKVNKDNLTRSKVRSSKKKVKKVKEVKEKRKRGFFGKLWLFIQVMVLLFLLACLGAAWYIYDTYGDMVTDAYTNSQEKIANLDTTIFTDKEETLIFDKDNKVLAELSTHKYVYLPFDSIPKNVKYSIIAIEDERFLEHDGVDIKALARAAYQLYRNKGEIKQGGSTITQQLIKTTLLTHEKTFSRKFEEIFIALELEKTTPKTKILEYYLNNIYFGNGAYGIESASNYYFSRPSKDLTVAETAFLMAIPNNPSLYDPIVRKDNTHKRQQRIIQKMADNGFITSKEATDATLEKIELAVKKRVVPPETYLVSFAISDATKQLMKANGFETKTVFETEEEEALYKESYGEAYAQYNEDIRNGGYIINTALDQQMQNKAQDSINKSLSYSTSKNDETGLYKRQGASVTIDNKTGLVKAIVGGRTQSNIANTFNRAYLAYRQPGSTIKPVLVYTQALESKYLPTSIVVDKKLDKGPKNVNDKYIGNTTLENAVKQSFNTVPHKLISDLGIKKSLQYLKDMNFARIVKDDEVPVSAIGGMTYGVTPLELASAYSTLARNGEFLQPTSIIGIKRTSGEEIYNFVQEPKRIYDAGASYLMTGILVKTSENNFGKSKLSGRIPNYITATKTGTTNDIKDVWYAGYTPYYTTVVWVGEDTPKRMNDKNSYDDPLTIWRKTMIGIHQGLPKATKFTRPEKALFVGYINTSTGRLSYTSRGGWKKDTIPLSRMIKQEEADAKIALEEQKIREEQAKKQKELDRQKAIAVQKEQEAIRKKEMKIDEFLKAQGSSLVEEKNKVSNIETVLDELQDYPVFNRNAYGAVDSKIGFLQRGIDSLLVIDNKEKYQKELDVEIDRVMAQKDLVERAVILEETKVARQANRQEEARLQEQARQKYRIQLENEAREEKERLAAEKTIQDRKDAEQRAIDEQDRLDREQEAEDKASPIPVTPPTTETPDKVEPPVTE